MPAFEDKTGQRFGRLLAIEPIRKKGARLTWRCACDCGGETFVTTDKLASGWTKSCGCLQPERTAAANATHGFARAGQVSATYRSWQAAKSRCYNPKNKRYDDYGARGIVMCAEWLDSFERFVADMGEAPKGLTLERKDVNGPYDASNCKWAGRKEQADNRRRTIWVDGLPL